MKNGTLLAHITQRAARHTCKHETAMPTASTGTTVPKMALHSSGVMKMPATVVTVVINTDSATSLQAEANGRVDDGEWKRSLSYHEFTTNATSQ